LNCNVKSQPFYWWETGLLTTNHPTSFILCRS